MIDNLHLPGVISPDTDLILAGTGSSSYVRTERSWQWLLSMVRQINAAIEPGVPQKPLVILSGGAPGWDYEMTLAAKELKLDYALCLPSPDYGAYYWGRAGRQAEFDQMHADACSIEYVNPSFIGRNSKAGHSNFDRNQRMVELATGFLVYDRGSPGTRHCVEVAYGEYVRRGDGTPMLHFCPR